MNEEKVAERYKNRLYPWNPEHEITRWWVGPDQLYFILVGGSLIGEDDWEHLANDFGITHVVNVETEHSDVGKFPQKWLCEQQFPDNGARIPESTLTAISKFCRHVFGLTNTKLYVHCQMGGSRSPAIAYFVLRDCFSLTPAKALAVLNDGFPHDPAHPYGYHPTHQSYIASIEDWLK